MLSFFSPASLRELVEDNGLRLVEDLGPEDADSRYLAGRTDGLRMPGFARLARVAVG